MNPDKKYYCFLFLTWYEWKAILHSLENIYQFRKKCIHFWLLSLDLWLGDKAETYKLIYYLFAIRSNLIFQHSWEYSLKLLSLMTVKQWYKLLATHLSRITYEKLCWGKISVYSFKFNLLSFRFWLGIGSIMSTTQ